MAEEELPNDPLAGAERLDGPTVADFNDLKARLAKLEAAQDSEDLSEDGEHRKLLIREVRQRMSLKRWLAWFGVIVVGVMIFLTYHAAHGLLNLTSHDLVPQSFAVALVVAPVASATTITALLLLGAFRRFKDSDTDKIDFQSIMSEALKHTSGH